MNRELRNTFDQELEAVLAELPQQVHDLIEKIPLVVEDYPSRDVLRRTRVRHRSQLCGLYSGIPLTRRSINDWGVPSDVVHIYREGILSQATRHDGSLSLPAAPQANSHHDPARARPPSRHDRTRSA